MNQHGTWSGTGAANSPVRRRCATGREQTPNPMYSKSGTWKPRTSPAVWYIQAIGKQPVRGADGCAGLRCRKTRMPGCNGSDRSSRFALLRKQADVRQVLHCGNHDGQDECGNLEDEDVLGHWSGSHSLYGIADVMLERKVLSEVQTMRVTFGKPFGGLEPDDGKLSRPVLRRACELVTVLWASNRPGLSGHLPCSSGFLVVAVLLRQFRLVEP